MALSPQRIAQARAEAELFLEYSIVLLASSLGVSVSDLGDSYINPFDVSNTGTASHDYHNHERLRRQVAAIAMLRSQS